MRYKGVIPPLVTPLDSRGDVCRKSVRQLVDFVRPYSTALMPTLSSGEGWKLNDRQFEDMIKYTVKCAQGLPVLAGVEFKTTEEVVEKLRIAKKLGADAVVVTTPFRKCSQEEIYEHFRRIRNEADSPVFIYNESAISGNQIEYETILRICELRNIVGIKEASGSVDFTKRLLDANLEVPIFQGWEHLCFESKGVDGYILPLSNLEPEVCLSMLQNPLRENQKVVDDLCKKYKILGDDWYVWLKKELYIRGIIATSRMIE